MKHVIVWDFSFLLVLACKPLLAAKFLVWGRHIIHRDKNFQPLSLCLAASLVYTDISVQVSSILCPPSWWAFQSLQYAAGSHWWTVQRLSWGSNQLQFDTETVPAVTFRRRHLKQVCSSGCTYSDILLWVPPSPVHSPQIVSCEGGELYFLCF